MLVDQFKKLGLKPGNTDGTYTQNVPLVRITPDPSMTLTFKKGAEADMLKFKDDFVAWTKRVSDSAALNDSELLSSATASAPEFKWDDYKGVDLKGKTMVVLINDPPLPRREDVRRQGDDLLRPLDLQVRDGREEAAGVLIVHETIPAGYPFSVIEQLGERFDLVAGQEHVASVGRGLDLARSGEAALREGRPGLRRAQDARRDA